MNDMIVLHLNVGTNNFKRMFNYNISTNNQLNSIDNGQSTPTTLGSFSYDVNGNQLSANTTRHYEWDYADRLIAYYNKTGTAEPSVHAHYLYDAGGNRVKKFVRTQGGNYEVVTYIDGAFEYHKQVSGTTIEKNELNIEGVARQRVGTAFPNDITPALSYDISNNIGSSTLRLDENGTAIDKEEYYPFGDSSLRTFSKKRYRYVGKEKDAESGLYYYGARYYSAWTCKFISVDPLAAEYPFYTPYNYAGNKPIGKIDIDGMQEEGESPQKSTTTITADNTLGENDSINIQTGDKNFDEVINAGFESIKQADDGVYFEVEIHMVDDKFVKGSFTVTAPNGDKISRDYSPSSGWSSIDIVDTKTGTFQFSPTAGDLKINDKTNENNIEGPGLGNLVDGIAEGAKLADKITYSTTPLKTTGKVKVYENGWGGNQYIKTTKVVTSETGQKVVKKVAKYAPIVGDLIDVGEVGYGMYEDSGVGENTVTQFAGVAGGMIGTSVGAYIGATIGTAIAPGLGTVIGAFVGAMVFSWAFETAAEEGARQIYKKTLNRPIYKFEF